MNRLLTSVFDLVNEIRIYFRSNGLMVEIFNNMFDELKEVKHFKEITDSICLIM